MKKKILMLLSIVIVGLTVCSAGAKVVSANPETAAAIKLYKGANYTQAYLKLRTLTLKEPENALAQYYYAMTCVRVGKPRDAIASYDVVMSLSPNGVLGSYAKRGKKCIETPERCHEPDVAPNEDNDTDEDKFIKGRFGTGFSQKARSMYEQQKIDNLKREINRYDEVEPNKFREYKDFSSQAPTDQEIVQALRVLQKAGLNGIYGTNGYNNVDLLRLTGYSNGNNGIDNNILNMLYGSNVNPSNINPQVIQSLLTTQMTTNF